MPMIWGDAAVSLATGLAPELHEAAPSSSAAPRAPLLGEQYARTLLHVYQGGDGVHAFVRDAALSAYQAAAVVANMSAELGEVGQRLASLTVNGKRVHAGVRPHAGASDSSPAPAPDPIEQLLEQGPK